MPKASESAISVIGAFALMKCKVISWVGVIFNASAPEGLPLRQKPALDQMLEGPETALTTEACRQLDHSRVGRCPVGGHLRGL